MITIVTPVYNEEKNIEELFDRVNKAFLKIDKKYKLLFVDNGSDDNSLNIIKKLYNKHSQVRFISLTKNFGHQGGIWAGLYNSNSTSIIMDADLQHPPEIIPDIIKKWEDGYKVVHTKKVNDNDVRIWKKIFSNFFYKIINKVTNLKLMSGQSDFCLIDLSVLSILKSLPERKNFIRGIIKSLGFNYSVVEYVSAKRKEGKSKFSFFEYINLAFDGILSFTKFPITVLFWMGLIISTMCFGYLIYLLSIVFTNIINLDHGINWYKWLTSPESIQNLFPPGWTSIIIAVLFIGSVQLIGMGILGKYITILIDNTKKRPEFFIKEQSEENINKDS